MTMAFHMTADQALQFFQLCRELNLTTEEERLALLFEMIAAGFDMTVFETKRTPRQIAEDYSKHGDVMWIKTEEDDENISQANDLY